MSWEPGPLRLRQKVALGLAIALGLTFRMLQWGHGLPEFLDEAWPFREAWAMWGWDAGRLALDPHRFQHPSLTLYLHFALQQVQYAFGLLTGAWTNKADYFLAYHTDPGALVVAARVMATTFELAGIGAIAWLGERLRPGAGLVAGVVLAISITMLHGVRTIVPDTYMAALSAGALLAMIRHLRDGRKTSLVAAVVLIGLATGAAYPAATLLLPLGVVLFMRRPGRAWLAWPIAAAGAFVVFLATTPYAVLDFHAFVHDVGFVRQLPAAGLGGPAGPRAAFDFGRLLGNLGPVGLVLLPVSLVLTVMHRRERREDIVLWVALAAYALPVFTARIEADRYLIPMLGPAALLACAALMDLAARAPDRWRAVSVALAPAVLVLPLVPYALGGALLRPLSTRVLAARWFEQNTDASPLIVQEAYGAALHTRLRALDMRSHRLFRTASDSARARYLRRPAFHAVQLPFVSVGPGTVVVPDSSGRPVTVRLASQAIEFDQLSYDPRLFEAVDFIVTTDAVGSRFMADSARFAAEAAFYRLLARTCGVAAEFHPGRGAAGPAITIRRVSPAFRAAARAMGPLDPLWWAATLPLSGRRALEDAALPPAARTDGAVRAPNGAAAPWVRVLDHMYASLVRPFAHPMSVYLVELGRDAPARFFARATLEVIPDDVEACLVYTTAAAADGEWADARGVIERTIGRIARDGEPPAALQTEYARILAKTGDGPLAREILESLAARSDPATAARARALIGELKL